MFDDTPNLPGLYEPVILERADSARRYAERLAGAGADEGTLVWAHSQSEGVGRDGNSWISGSRNLHLAIIIRPEESFDTCCQLGPVATLCTAAAISHQAEPLEEIRLRWPNDVLLNRAKVAGVTLSGKLKTDRAVEWLVVGVNVNVWTHPDTIALTTASMRGEGFESCDRVLVLEGFAREFLSWANRWANEGFEPIRRTWRTRGLSPGNAQRVRVGDEWIAGRFVDIDANGSLELSTESNGARRLTLSEFFADDFER